MIINYYCLSLKKYRKDRFLITKNESFIPNKIPIIEFDGIDGSFFNTSKEISKKYNLKLGNLMLRSSPILIAIAQSHRNIWKDIMDNDIEYGIIFEDDIKITTKNFVNKIIKNIKFLKNLKGPKILSIGYLFVEKGNKINNQISKTSQFSGLQCYLIDKATANYLYNNTFLINDQIDTVISDYLTIDKYFLNQPLVYQKEIASIAHNQRFIFLEYNNVKFLSRRIGINFKLNISTGYHINFTYYTILNILFAILLKLFIYNIWILLYYFVFLTFETFFYGGVNWIDHPIFNGINKYSTYDDDEVVNKYLDFLLYSFFYTIY